MISRLIRSRALRREPSEAGIQTVPATASASWVSRLGFPFLPMGAIVSNTEAPPPLKMTFVGGSGVGISQVDTFLNDFHHTDPMDHLPHGTSMCMTRHLTSQYPIEPGSQRTGKCGSGRCIGSRCATRPRPRIMMHNESYLTRMLR